MREKLARALAANDAKYAGKPFEGLAPWLQRMFISDADAVLATLREPTEAMKRAGQDEAERQVYGVGGGEWGEAEGRILMDGETSIFTAMIDAAKEG